MIRSILAFDSNFAQQQVLKWGAIDVDVTYAIGATGEGQLDKISFKTEISEPGAESLQGDLETVGDLSPSTEFCSWEEMNKQVD